MLLLFSACGKLNGYVDATGDEKQNHLRRQKKSLPTVEVFRAYSILQIRQWDQSQKKKCEYFVDTLRLILMYMYNVCP